MNESSIKTENVFLFWRAIEALTPQDIDKENARDKLNPVYKVGAGSMLPWDDPEHTRKDIAPGKVWRYSAQAGVYHLSEISKMLEDKIGAHEAVPEERKSGKCRLFDIGFNEEGIPQPATFMLSLSAWSAAQILRHDRGVYALHAPLCSDVSDLPAPNDSLPLVDSGFYDFDNLTLHLMQWVDNEAYRLQEEGQKADTGWLKTLEKLVIAKLYFPEEAMDTTIVSVVKCSLTRKAKVIQEDSAKKDNKKKEAVPDDLINSFFIQELRKLDAEWRQGGGGAGFKEFIMAITRDNQQRLDIRTEEGLDFAFEKLLPTQPPAGSWPSKYPLAFSQQLAVNEIWTRNHTEPGIFAVNGPPGTGKTTLLRDVVAAVVTDRASKLVKLGDSAFKAKDSLKYDDRLIPYYSLHPSLAGSAIVIASSNNGAVENISLELPGMEAVPEDVSDRSDYFGGLATVILNRPAWGLLAARLGNKSNREQFVNTLWWGNLQKSEKGDEAPPEKFSPERGEGLKYHLNLLRPPRKVREPALTWTEAVTRFEQAQAVEEAERQQLAVSYTHLNEQILSPAAEKLDQFVALGSGGQYANYQEQAQTAPDTSGVSSAGAITGGMDSQRGLTSSNLGQHQEAARVQPSTSIGGISAQTLSGNNGRQYVEDEAGKGASRVLSSGDRDKLNYIRENMPVGSPKETYESAKQAGDAADATTGKAQSLVLGDPKSSDYKASTQQTMQSLQTEEPPKSIDTFRSSGDRTSDAESALAQAALHAANANNQIGTAREQSLAESNAYREKYNQITGSNLSEAGVERIVRQAADGKNNGFSGGLKDVISAEVNGTGTTGRPVTGSADSSLGKELRENNGASEHPMDKASAAFQKTGDAIPGHEVASDLAQRVAGIIPGGNALVPDIGSQRNVPNAMGISNNRAPGSLISNISNNIQLSQAVDSASVNAGINDEKFTRMSDQNQMLTESVQKALANDSRYGPDVAAEYPKFIASLPSNIGVNEGTKMTKDFLDKHRKN